MKNVLVFLKDFKKEAILAPLFKMFEAISELFVPLIVASIIDNGIKNGDKSYVIKMSLLLVLIGIVGLSISITAQYFSAKAAVGFSAKLRHALYEHLMGLSFTEVDGIGTSTMITRMTSDVNQAQTGVNMFLRLFLRSPFVVFGALIMAFTINVSAAMIFVCVILILSLIVFLIMKTSIVRQKTVQKNLEGILQTTRENLSGIRVIRAFCKEPNEYNKFCGENQNLCNTQKKAGNISALLNPLTYISINLAIIVLIWVGAIKVDSGILTQGQVIALYNYMSQILVELIKFANLIITLNKSIASINRISDVFDAKSSKKNGTKQVSESSSDYIIEFKDVSLIYKNCSDKALQNISFAVKKGQTVGIIGSTGSGKSSVVNLIPRFYDATKGEVLFNGENVKNIDSHSLLRQIGIVMQKAVLFKGTIRDNLLWGNKSASDNDISEAVSTSQSGDVVDSKGGLDSDILQGGKNLSGGQKQRLTIARALVKKPKVLILDDSASALDYATDAKLRQAIKKLDSNMTVFIVSQRAASIQFCDLIVVLDDGRIVGKGTHKELLENCVVYNEIYYSQFEKKDNSEAV